jgi:hypothetical protein
MVKYKPTRPDEAEVLTEVGTQFMQGLVVAPKHYSTAYETDDIDYYGPTRLYTRAGGIWSPAITPNSGGQADLVGFDAFDLAREHTVLIFIKNQDQNNAQSFKIQFVRNLEGTPTGDGRTR